MSRGRENFPAPAGQNEAIVSALPAVHSAQAVPHRKILLGLLGLSSVCQRSSAERHWSPLENMNVPPILPRRGGEIFPSPGQREKPFPSRFEFFHSFRGGTGGFGDYFLFGTDFLVSPPLSANC